MLSLFAGSYYKLGIFQDQSEINSSVNVMRDRLFAGDKYPGQGLALVVFPDDEIKSRIVEDIVTQATLPVEESRVRAGKIWKKIWLNLEA